MKQEGSRPVNFDKVTKVLVRDSSRIRIHLWWTSLVGIIAIVKAITSALTAARVAAALSSVAVI